MIKDLKKNKKNKGKKLKKYNLSSEIKILRFFKFKMFKFLIPICNLFLTILPKDRRSNKDIKVKKYKIKSFDDKKIKVYEYIPNEKCDKALLYFHGGAFYLKGTPYHYKLCKKYALLSNKKVFFVEYRLSFKNKYPTGVRDGYEVYKWILNNSKELEIDKNCVGVGGDSAGGSISIGLSIMANEEKIILPNFMLLVYPVIDKDLKTKSLEEFVDTPMWNSKLNEKMWKYYLKDCEYKSPFKNLVNIRTYIEVAEFDPLRDEGILYFDFLNKNGVDVVLNKTTGTVHGYDILYNSNIAKENIENRIVFLKK